PRASSPVTVTFTASDIAAFTGTLRIASNDPVRPLLSMALSGAGVAPPVVGVEPDSLYATLLTGSHETQTLRILNSGGSPLDFSLKVRPRSPAGGACVATHALVTEFSGGELSRVDLATGSVTQVVGGLSAPVGIVLEPTGNTALVVERD